jgi:hypothetical protein
VHDESSSAAILLQESLLEKAGAIDVFAKRPCATSIGATGRELHLRCISRVTGNRQSPDTYSHVAPNIDEPKNSA